MVITHLCYIPFQLRYSIKVCLQKFQEYPAKSKYAVEHTFGVQYWSIRADLPSIYFLQVWIILKNLSVNPFHIETITLEANRGIIQGKSSKCSVIFFSVPLKWTLPTFLFSLWLLQKWLHSIFSHLVHVCCHYHHSLSRNVVPPNVCSLKPLMTLFRELRTWTTSSLGGWALNHKIVISYLKSRPNSLPSTAYKS